MTSAVCASSPRVKVSFAVAAGRERPHLSGEVVRTRDRDAVELGDDVPGLQTRGLRGAVVGDLVDERAGDRALGVARGVLHGRAEQAVGRLAVLDDLVGDALGEVRRDGEADTDAAGLAADESVLPALAIATLMPISLPSRVEQRATGVAGVDRRVGLDDREWRSMEVGVVAGASGPECRSSRSRGCRSFESLEPPSSLDPESGTAEEATVMLRLRALTMPSVTVPASPSGAPIATAVSPTLSLSSSPNSIGLRPEASSSLMTARS